MGFDEFAKGTAGIITALTQLLAGVAAVLRALGYPRRKQKGAKPPVKRPERQPWTPLRAAFLGAGIVLILMGSAVLGRRYLPEFFDPSQTVEITQIPLAGQSPPDSLVAISGVVGGVHDLHEYYVVIYAYTNRWYVQPFVDQPLTSIQTNGEWTNTIHRGSAYAVLLVSKSYRPPSSVDALPVIGGDVLAFDRRPGRTP